MRTPLLALAAAALLSIPASSQAQTIKTHSGVIKSISTDKTGSIGDIYLTLSGSYTSQRILGCSAKLQAQPLMLWAFENKRLVHITADASNCFSTILVGN